MILTADQLDQKIDELISQKRVGDFSFDRLESFKMRLDYLRNPKNRYSVSDLFGDGRGQAAAKTYLTTARSSDGKKLFTKTGRAFNRNDFKGLYVWFHGDNAFYVGIAGGVVNRLYQHVKVTSHYSASMAYKIAARVFEVTVEGRANFPREKIRRVQNWLIQQQVAFIEIEDNDELAAFEIFCSIELEAVLNSFETH